MYPAAAAVAPENEGCGGDHLNFMRAGLLRGEIRVLAC